MTEKRKGLKLHTQLLITFLVLSILPLILFGMIVYKVVEDAITRQAQNYFVQSVGKERELIDSRLNYIEEFSQKLNIDERIYSIFSEINHEDTLELKKASNQIHTILNSYKPWDSDIYSVHLVTSYYRFGEEDKNYYPQGTFYASTLAQKAVEAKGRLVWVPTYDYVEMFQLPNLKKNQLEYGLLFTAVRQMNVSDVSSGRVRRLEKGQENPILVVNFTEDFLLSMLLEYEQAYMAGAIYYMVMDESGHIVCSTDPKYKGGMIYEGGWLGEQQGGSNAGSLIQQTGGRKELITFTKSELTGWTVAAFVSIQELIRDINRDILTYMAVILVGLVILSVASSFYISNYLNRKVYNLLTTINMIGTGEFGRQLSFRDSDEFAFFYEGVNQMSLNLKKMIHENYEVKLQQKDFEVMILNIQLNPHFLYNTLNIINWICREGDLEKAGNMIVELSRMLQYTSHNKNQKAILGEDIKWLERYLSIMKKRFENEFEVTFSIEEELLACEVPKLFLQPLIENAIVHGFRNLDKKGSLDITAEREAQDIIFIVEDNGNGMTRQRIKEVMEYNGTSIGVANTDRRIKILYGSEYGITIESQLGEGTVMIVRIPLL